MARSTLGSCLATLLCAASATPAAADPLAIRTEGDLPFAASELEAALAVRAAVVPSEATHSARTITATVSPHDTTVRIAVLGRDRDVALEGARGVDAARLVAFAILDLAGDQLDPPRPSEHAPVPRMQVVEPSPKDANDTRRVIAAHDARAAAHDASGAVASRDDGDGADRRDDANGDVSVDATSDAHEPRAALAVWARGGTRTESELELAVGVAGPVRVLMSGGASTRVEYQTISATAFGQPASIRSYPLRAGLAWRGPQLWLGELDVRAGAVAVVESASGQLSNTSAIYGGGAAVGWAVPITELVTRGARGSFGATVTLAAGADAFATSNDYRLHMMSVTTTPRFAWWGGVAVAAELWR